MTRSALKLALATGLIALAGCDVETDATDGVEVPGTQLVEGADEGEPFVFNASNIDQFDF